MSAGVPSAPPPAPLPGRYRHFKGQEYEVLGSALHSETREPVVIYRALYGDYALFVRPAAMFAEQVTRDGVTQPRFAWLGPSRTRRFGHDAQQAARDFLFTQARPLEVARYRHDFEQGDAAAVYAALAAYQNTDGGFGHGLEPDLNTPDSSALATTTALQVLRDLDTPADHPLVQGAIAWLRANYDAAHARWPLIPPTANNAPHAPWWTVGPDHPTWFRHYAVNPRAEILGYLYAYPALADAAQVQQVGDALRAHYGALAQPLDMNELLCTLRLLAAPNLPEALHAAAHAAVTQALPVTMAQDAEAWESYSLQPLAVAPTPQSPFAAAVAHLLPANLDFRIADQQPDGAWAPAWSWGDLYPHAWPAAQRAWQGILTLDALRSLHAYGRFAL